MRRLLIGDDRDRILSPDQRRAKILDLLLVNRYDAFQLARLLDCSVGAAHHDCLTLMAEGQVLPIEGRAKHTVWVLRVDGAAGKM